MSKTRLFDRRGKIASPDYKFTGTEPQWSDAENLSVEEYYRRQDSALRFYNYYCDAKFFKEQVVIWMGKNKYTADAIKAMKALPPHAISGVAGKFVRMLDQGMPDSHPDAREHFAGRGIEPYSATDWIKKFIGLALHDYDPGTVISIEDPDQAKAPPAPKPNPQERLANKINEDVITVLDGLLDSICEIQSDTAPAKIPTINLGNFLRSHKIPPRGSRFVIEWLDKQLEEFKGALDKTDEELVEGYGWLKPAQLRRVVSNFEKMREDAVLHGAIKQTNRKPRVKKPKTADKQVAGLKYAINSSEYVIDSIDPVHIPFCQRLYTFNVKYRQLTIYIAENATGLSVKGTTIRDFDPEKSVTLTLRKPSDILPNILSKTARQIDKIIESLKVKPKPANGRCNENILLLRSFDK